MSASAEYLLPKIHTVKVKLNKSTEITRKTDDLMTDKHTLQPLLWAVYVWNIFFPPNYTITTQGVHATNRMVFFLA